MAKNIPLSDNKYGSEHTLPILDCLKQGAGRKYFVQNKKIIEPEFICSY